jgi:hypothetical protein
MLIAILMTLLDRQSSISMDCICQIIGTLIGVFFAGWSK